MEGHFTVPPLPLDGGGVRSGAPPPAQGDSGSARAGGPPNPPADPATTSNDAVAGISALRGLLLYAAVLSFAGLFIYFMVLISDARTGVKPHIDATFITAAAALSGVLGSAFALRIGVAPDPSLVNTGLARHAAAAKQGEASPVAAGIRRAMSLEPSDVDAKSWPLTFGIWAYAIVAAAVVAVYVLNQNETPDAVKALAVTFSGYVIALINAAYGLTRSAPGG
ncbi:MAG: hypothetical protein ACR2KV_00445 [Solirubrobacteraceae bacterium]